MNKNLLSGLDLSLVVPVLVLTSIGLVTLFSLNPLFFRGQFLLFIISIFSYLFFSQSNSKVIKIYTRPIYVFSLIALSFVLFLGIESRGAVRWVEIFGFRIQFSEILKPFLAISLAGYLSYVKTYSLKTFLTIILLFFPVFGLIFFQPDLGNGIIYGLVLMSTLLYIGFPFRYFLSLFLPFLLSAPFLWGLLHDYQKQRILTFLNPSADPLGASYNIIQSIIAVGSGMVMGKGIGQGTQSGLRFLPERQTDFIFATISEQLGFIGVIIVLLSFAFLLYRILTIYLNSQDYFEKNLSAIFFFTLLIQLFLNIGMNIGILPIVGVTLPFVSYGGSSLLSSFIFLGIISSINKNKNREVLEIR